MTTKAIILDIDGTLLNSSKQISQTTKAALLSAQQNGLKVILASGRPTTGMQALAQQLQMAEYGGYLVSYNGAMVTDCRTQEVLFDQAMSVELGKNILAHLKQFDVIPMIAKDDYMYVNNVYNNILHLPDGDFNIIEYEARGGNFKLCEMPDLAAFVDFKLNKILVAGEADYLAAHHEALRAPFADTVSSAFSAPFYYEFTDRGIDKAKALDTVFPPLGIKAADMIAFGDGHNDLSIITYAGTGVAMGNAVPELKEAADAVTLSNDEDGIAAALTKFLG